MLWIAYGFGCFVAGFALAAMCAAARRGDDMMEARAEYLRDVTEPSPQDRQN